MSRRGPALAAFAFRARARRRSGRFAGALARAAIGTLALAALAGLAACGGGAPDSVVVRVGRVAITSATVQRWMSAMAGGRTPSDPSQRRALRAQALGFLISSQWLLGEAAADGLRPSAPEVQRRFAQKRRASFPGGEQELRAFLRATGQSVSDIVFEAKAELASAKLRQALASREPPITHAQIASYYGRHRGRFEIPERRTVEITNRHSQAAALAVKREVAAGRRFASFASRMSFPLSPASYSLSLGRDAALARAIHFARPNVLTGPVLVNRDVDHYLVEVKEITPASERPLEQVQGAIARQLAAERRRRTLGPFIAAWRGRWIARTSCSHGYVVQKCREYSGARSREDPLAFD